MFSVLRYLFIVQINFKIRKVNLLNSHTPWIPLLLSLFQMMWTWGWDFIISIQDECSGDGSDELPVK